MLFRSITTDTLAPGEHVIAAYYEGDSVYLGLWSSVHTVQVNVNGTAVALTSSSATTTVGDDLTLYATVDPSGGTPLTGPTGLVYFFDSSTNTWLGSATLDSGVATFTTDTLGVGTHIIVAYYAGDSVFDVSWSDPLTQTVVA